MPKYQVDVQEVHNVKMIVDAKDAAAARQKANTALDEGAYEDGTPIPPSEYAFTIDDPEQWPTAKIG